MSKAPVTESMRSLMSSEVLDYSKGSPVDAMKREESSPGLSTSF